MTISVFIEELPDDIHGVSAKRGPDNFIVIINGNDTKDRQKAAFLHEMGHIWNGDHDSPEPVQEIEARAHEII